MADLEGRRYYLKEWRKHFKLKQWEIAERLGVTPVTISRWENYDPENDETRAINVPDLIRYADAIGIDPALMLHPPADAPVSVRVLSLSPELQTEVDRFVSFLESRERAGV